LSCGFKRSVRRHRPHASGNRNRFRSCQGLSRAGSGGPVPLALHLGHHRVAEGRAAQLSHHALQRAPRRAGASAERVGSDHFSGAVHASLRLVRAALRICLWGCIDLVARFHPA
jgi:hypothetical protein